MPATATRRQPTKTESTDEDLAEQARPGQSDQRQSHFDGKPAGTRSIAGEETQTDEQDQQANPDNRIAAEQPVLAHDDPLFDDGRFGRWPGLADMTGIGR